MGSPETSIKSGDFARNMPYIANRMQAGNLDMGGCGNLMIEREPYGKVELNGNRRKRSLSIVVAVLLLAGLTGACGSDGPPQMDYEEMPAEPLYDKGVEYMLDGKYNRAAERFAEVERQHPYSTWATRAQLMSAFSYYKVNEYGAAVSDAQRFISLHPGHRDTPYAYYLVAMCFYEPLSDVLRDQDMTQRSQAGFEDLVRRFPDSDYAREARLKIELTKDHLAGKEMAIGRYYLRRKQYVGALNRFREVIAHYQTTTHIQEALHRLAETYAALGLHEEVRKAVSVLGHNYPESDWYSDGLELATNLDTMASPVLASDIRKGDRQDNLLDRIRKNIF